MNSVLLFSYLDPTAIARVSTIEAYGLTRTVVFYNHFPQSFLFHRFQNLKLQVRVKKRWIKDSDEVRMLVLSKLATHRNSITMNTAFTCAVESLIHSLSPSSYKIWCSPLCGRNPATCTRKQERTFFLQTYSSILLHLGFTIHDIIVFGFILIPVSTIEKLQECRSVKYNTQASKLLAYSKFTNLAIKPFVFVWPKYCDAGTVRVTLFTGTISFSPLFRQF